MPAGFGVREVDVTAKPDKRWVVRLYRGFVVGRLETDYFGPGEDRLIMVAQPSGVGRSGYLAPR